jgi:hypothetical protein
VPTRIREHPPLLFVPPPDVPRQPADVCRVRDRLEPLELVRVDVARDKPIRAEHEHDARAGEPIAVQPGIRDVTSEAAGVVHEEHIERPELGVRDHPAEVGPPQGVLARHQVEVLAPRRLQPVSLREACLLRPLDLRTVAVGLSASRLPDVASPRSADQVLGSKVN